MRYIDYQETTFSATEIAARFLAEHGVDLHPTNVGNVAKRLDLDFVELPFSDAKLPWVTTQRQYGEGDLPQIFEELRDLAAHRAQFQRPVQD